MNKFQDKFVGKYELSLYLWCSQSIAVNWDTLTTHTWYRFKNENLKKKSVQLNIFGTIF